MEIVRGNNFNDSLVGLQRTSILDLSLLTNSNFNITPAYKERNKVNFNNYFSNTSGCLTRDTPIIQEDERVNFNLDYSKPLSFLLFNSTVEYFRSTIERIIYYYPASLYVDKIYNNIRFFTIIDYSYDTFKDESSFFIPGDLVINDYNLIFTNSENNTESENFDNYKNVILNFTNYLISRTDKDEKLKILNMEFPDTKSGYLKVTTKGEFIEEISSGNYSINIHIHPNEKIFKEYHDKIANGFEKYILSNSNDQEFTFQLQTPVQTENSYQITTQTYIWKKSDGYNPDFQGDDFDLFFRDFLQLGELYDDFKTDLLYRQLLPSSLKDWDNTDNSEFKDLVRIYGKNFDDLKIIIDFLTKITTLSYRNIKDVPAFLLKNLANLLSFDYFEFIDDDVLLQEFLSEGGIDGINIPEDNNLDIWKRMLLNANWLWSSKGTRKSINFIFDFMGFPDYMVLFDEHIYDVNNKLSYTLKGVNEFEESLEEIPINNQGYPTRIKENQTVWFQKFGDLDTGQRYIDIYREFGWDVERIVDNVKTSEQQRLDIINTKEINFGLDIAAGIEYDMYFMNISECPNNCEDIGFTLQDFNTIADIPANPPGGTTTAYPITIDQSLADPTYPYSSLTIFDAKQTTFAEYIDKIYKYFINTQNRKVIDNQERGYPTLRKIYNDYLETYKTATCLTSNEYTPEEMFAYLDRIDTRFFKLFERVIPETAILIGGGAVVRNTIFTQQKHVYKRGINEGSEFVKEQFCDTCNSAFDVVLGVGGCDNCCPESNFTIEEVAEEDIFGVSGDPEFDYVQLFYGVPVTSNEIAVYISNQSVQPLTVNTLERSVTKGDDSSYTDISNKLNKTSFSANESAQIAYFNINSVSPQFTLGEFLKSEVIISGVTYEIYQARVNNSVGISFRLIFDGTNVVIQTRMDNRNGSTYDTEITFLGQTQNYTNLPTSIFAGAATWNDSFIVPNTTTLPTGLIPINIIGRDGVNRRTEQQGIINIKTLGGTGQGQGILLVAEKDLSGDGSFLSNSEVQGTVPRKPPRFIAADETVEDCFLGDDIDLIVNKNRVGDFIGKPCPPEDFPEQPQSTSLVKQPFPNDGTKAEVLIEWIPQGQGERYIIERSEDGENFTIIATTIENGGSYIDLIDAEKEYYYRIAAINECGKSAYSFPAMVTFAAYTIGYTLGYFS